MSAEQNPVSIVLATYNGASFLEAQLRSLLMQDYENWHLILSDDGSTDDTLAIARRLVPPKRLHIHHGPRAGLVQNFWNGLMHAPSNHYLAFCDQDDVWYGDKLTRAISRLKHCKSSGVYSSGRHVTDSDLNIFETQERKPVGHFVSAFLRNPIAGHTCVLNPQSLCALRQVPPNPHVPFHDWWATLVLKGLGASFFHDPEPTLLYRQHSGNVIGASGNRVQHIFDGTYQRWLRCNYLALRPYRKKLMPAAQRALHICLPLAAGLSVRGE